MKNKEEIEDGLIEVFGARMHNLKNIDIAMPRNKLIVITGLSGSGKSSLAFDTIFAEGQRRYLETFNAYARQFVGNLERPDVDKIDGLSPVIAIEQKTVSKNPRSTVGTITEVYDFLRLLYARAADAYSYISGERMVKMNEDQIIQKIFTNFHEKKIMLLAPVVKGRKGHYRELFEQIRKQGYSKVRIDGKLQDIVPKMQTDRYKIHDIEILIDRVQPGVEKETRIKDSIKMAMKTGKGIIMVAEADGENVQHYSRFLMDPVSGISYDEPQPNTFSFNSPYGACPTCDGLGSQREVNEKFLIPDHTKSIIGGALAPMGEYRNNWTFAVMKALGKRHKFGLNDSINSLKKNQMEILLNGDQEQLDVEYEFASGYKQIYHTTWEGLANYVKRQYLEKPGDSIAAWAEDFMEVSPCPSCHGTRLKQESLCYKIADTNIAQLAEMDLLSLGKWMENVESKLDERQKIIATEVLKEIRSRLGFLLNVGLEYLTLNSPARTLSGGEAQRIRLATQIGSQLTGVLYILDEPSIGLHQRDNHKLIESLKNLRDIGNTVMVVEHDKDMMMDADYIVDIGPGAGSHGGHIVAQGNLQEFMKQNSVTSQYISGKRNIDVPKKRRAGNGKHIELKGCTGNNLKGVDASFPLGKFICVTGVSGSGKSSLINETLYPLLHKHFYQSRLKPLPHKSITGLKNIDKVIEIDQSPIGRTPRSNPATYVEVYTDIRNLFTNLPEAKIRGYKPGRFSFNVKGGRCETCEGGGMRAIEMNFLPDVYVQCETCKGKRYNRETLEIRYKGKSISDVLDMSIEHAVEFFEPVPSIYRKIKTLKDVGLGYITLGQQSTTLSGGEAQRVKLATELSKRDTGNTFYILDEPTTGLHFDDVKVLLDVLNLLVDKGNTVLVIEHNMDVIKVSDYIIDIGPEGGNGGGQVLATGTPEELIKVKKSYTAQFLKKELS